MLTVVNIKCALKDGDFCSRITNRICALGNIRRFKGYTLFLCKEYTTPTPGAVWKLDKAELNSDVYKPNRKELNIMREKLGAEIGQLYLSF